MNDTTSIKSTATLRLFRNLGEPPRVPIRIDGDEVLQAHALFQRGLLRFRHSDGKIEARLTPKGCEIWDAFFDVVDA